MSIKKLGKEIVFSGTGDDITLHGYIKAWESIVPDSKDRTKDSFVRGLKGHALKVWLSIDNPNINTVQIIESMKRIFGGGDDQTLKDLNNLQFKRFNSLDELISRFTLCVKGLDIQEAQAVRLFMNSCGGNLAFELRKNPPLNLIEAYIKARGLERLYIDTFGTSLYNPSMTFPRTYSYYPPMMLHQPMNQYTPPVQATPSTFPQLPPHTLVTPYQPRLANQQVTPIPFNIGDAVNANNYSENRARKRFRCYNCDIIGHMERDCRKKKHDSQEKRNYRNARSSYSDISSYNRTAFIHLLNRSFLGVATFIH